MKNHLIIIDKRIGHCYTCLQNGDGSVLLAPPKNKEENAL